MMRLNWYRGFYGIWLLCSVVWMMGMVAWSISATNAQRDFEKRVAASHAANPSLLLDWNGDVCEVQSKLFLCQVDPPGP
jgi:hypothetical protein